MDLLLFHGALATPLSSRRGKPDGMTTLLVVLTVVLLIPQSVEAATNSVLWSGDPVFRSWQTKDGLPQNTVYAITQTRDGYLWVGTGGGLARFDGLHFRTFGVQEGLRSVQISALVEDRQGVLWVGTRGGGLSRFENGRFTTLSSAEGVPEMVEALAADDAGRLWIGTPSGLVEYRNGKARFLGAGDGLPRMHVNALLNDSKGCLWVSVLMEGLYRGTNGAFVPLEKTAATPGGVYTLFEDKEHSIWAGSGNANLWHFREGVWKRDDHTNGLPATALECIGQAADGTLLVGARNSGLFSRRGTGFEHLRGSAGLAGDSVRALFLDRDGALWAGTGSSGLNRLSRRTVRAWSSAEGLQHRIVTSVAEDRSGTLWVGTPNGGIYKFRNGRFEKLSDPNVSGNYPYIYTVLTAADGSVWAAGEGTLYHFRQGQATRAFNDAPVAGEAIRAICEDGPTLWLGTYYATLFKFERDELKVAATNGSFAGGITSLVRETTNTLWIGTTSGLYLWNNGIIKSWGIADGLLCTSIHALHRDPDGTLWVGTLGGGLARIREGQVLNITSQQGLVDEVISEIIPDDFGHLWLGCNHGIMRLERKEIDALANGTGSFVHAALLDQNDGMLKEQCTGGHSPTAIKTMAGQLIFPTLDGIVEVDPRVELEWPATMPEATIEQVQVDGLPRDPLAPLVIPPGGGRLEISYDAPGLTGAAPIHFRFRLDPLDKSWVDAGTRRSAYYPRLRPGQYSFRVSASNSRGEWSERAATLGITLQPYLWQTLSFQVFVALAFCGAVFAIYRRRFTEMERKRVAQEAFTRQLILSQENERKRLASDLHDGLGQDLLVLKNRLGLLAANAKQSPELAQKLTEISADASRAISEVREISQALRPAALEQVGFTRAVEWMVEQLGKTSPQTKFSTELQEIDGLLASDQEISLYRIIQEGLSNATRHADASRVMVEVRHEAGRLRVSLFDDGKGFEPRNTNGNGHVRPGFGLAGMTERAKVLGGRIEIQSERGKGTRLTLTAPLTSKP